MATLKETDWLNAVWTQARKKYPMIEELIAEGQRTIAYNFDTFARETFARLSCPMLEPLETIRTEGEWIAAIHAKLERNLDWKLLCDTVATVGDTVDDCAMTALHCFLKWLLREIPAPRPPLIEDIEELRRAVLALKERVPGIDVSGMVDKGKETAEAMKAYAAAVNAVEMDEISRMCRQAFNDFSTLVEPVLAAGVAMGGAGIVGDLDDKVKFQKALKGSRKLRQIVELVGKMVKRADAIQDAKDDRGKHTVDGVTLGDDLDMATGEAVAESKLNWFSFASKYITKSISQFRLGVDAKREGPIVILLDDTGSMEGSTKGCDFSKEVWGKAAAWAVLSIAVKQGRHCRLIHYGDGTLRVDDFEPGESDLEKMIDTMEFFGSDGTNYEPAAFNDALDCIESVDAYSGADIIFITDGGWGCGKSGDQADEEKGWVKTFPQRLKDANVAVYSILIACGDRGLPKFLTEDEGKLIFIGDIANDVNLDRLFDSL